MLGPTPIFWLSVLLALTLLAITLLAARQRRIARSLLTLARSVGMNYSPIDRFDLARKLHGNGVPIAASDLHASDILYGLRRGIRRYLVTMHYTLDARRRVDLIAVCESKKAYDFEVREVQINQLPSATRYEAMLPSLRDPDEATPPPGDDLSSEEPVQNQPTLWQRLLRLGPAAVLAVLALVLPPLGSAFLLWKITPISAWLRGNFATGSVTFILCCWIFGGLAVMPQHTMSILGGWAFGFWAGLAITLVAFLGAGLVGYGIAYRLSGDRVQRMIDENAKWKRIHFALVHGSWWHTLLIVFLIRLTPNMPFALTNLVMASTGVKLGKFMLGTLLGLIPRTAILVYTASEMSTLDFQNAGDRRLLIIAILIAIVALVSITLVAKSALKRATA